jgi:hypothetical protein
VWETGPKHPPLSWQNDLNAVYDAINHRNRSDCVGRESALIYPLQPSALPKVILPPPSFNLGKPPPSLLKGTKEMNGIERQGWQPTSTISQINSQAMTVPNSQLNVQSSSQTNIRPQIHPPVLTVMPPQSNVNIDEMPVAVHVENAVAKSNSVSPTEAPVQVENTRPQEAYQILKFRLSPPPSPIIHTFPAAPRAAAPTAADPPASPIYRTLIPKGLPPQPLSQITSYSASEFPAIGIRPASVEISLAGGVSEADANTADMTESR